MSQFLTKLTEKYPPEQNNATEIEELYIMIGKLSISE